MSDPQLDLNLLQAVDEAANAEGWATASEIGYLYDGRTVGSGTWARRLWNHEALGLLERRWNTSRAVTLWGLTEAGGEALYTPFPVVSFRAGKPGR